MENVLEKGASVIAGGQAVLSEVQPRAQARSKRDSVLRCKWPLPTPGLGRAKGLSKGRRCYLRQGWQIQFTLPRALW